MLKLRTLAHKFYSLFKLQSYFKYTKIILLYTFCPSHHTLSIGTFCSLYPASFTLIRLPTNKGWRNKKRDFSFVEIWFLLLLFGYHRTYNFSVCWAKPRKPLYIFSHMFFCIFILFFFILSSVMNEIDTNDLEMSFFSPISALFFSLFISFFTANKI